MPRHAVPTPPTTVLYIKHMVCARGIRVVRRELEQLGLQVLDVRLGAATVVGAAGDLNWAAIRQALGAAQFALLESFHQTLLERVDAAVQKLLRQAEPCPRHRAFGAAVAAELALPYSQLNAAYTRLSGGRTVAAFIVHQRLLYAQELLATSPLGVSAVARRLGYSSLAHFSGQFRRLTRCSPSAYRKRGAQVQFPAPRPPQIMQAEGSQV
ncbi:AraC-like DNA-binding protein [Hymenobacter luteus]|uniref:AraC-like DNA-binding protein n=2 Tax=Hymenobacter TaxID=89966 RepID=A0A7W9T4B8_9BACT|nr:MULTISPECIES: AraC family transcriptional regulator [Hymenobacter]MBB4603527.1 AraC-like DNA-binding protein [Hymenobacter latericoloratus]MBB6061300.1 AraC-like DNA-binding protein [Hymenobacter luteus]